MAAMVRDRAIAGVLSLIVTCLSCQAPFVRRESMSPVREMAADSSNRPAALPQAAPPETAKRDEAQVGYATWYGRRFAGRMTANGERFDPNRMTAAHRTLPFGTWVEVKRVDTGALVRVRITDRGPFGHDDRIIDLSRVAAQKLGFVDAGLARVELRVVSGP
jgi:rare lipoprotein A